MTVYADILFLVNLSLNWFSLILTSKIIKHKSSALKMLFSAAVGAVLGTVTVFFNSTLATAIIEIASSFLMCAVAFRSDGFFDYIKICSYLFASGITLGGSLTFIYSFFNRVGIEFPKQNDISAAVFLLMSLSVTVTAALFEKLIFTKRHAEKGIVTFELGDKRLSLQFLSDSGNLLCEPISGRPAIFVKTESLIGFLPQEILEFNPVCSEKLPETGFARLRLLPASTVCGESLVTGFIPDNTIIEFGKHTKYADAVIALDRIRKNDTYAGACAIVPGCLL